MRQFVPVLAVALVALASLAGGCATAPSGEPEAVSLLGTPLYPMALPPDEREKREAQLAEARRVFDRDPSDLDAIIWLGRRTAYLGRYREAIAIFTDGLRVHPDSPRLLRHRGHRYVTVRQFDDAIADLSRAAQLVEGQPDAVEADGQPNRLNRPTSTTQGNIHYHLGLAHYLKGEFDEALPVYRRGLALARNDDSRCAASYWLYFTLRRLKRPDEAAAVLDAINPGMDVIENMAYHHLLLVYKGVMVPSELLAGANVDGETIDDATLGYGIAAWHVMEGQRPPARDVLERVVQGAAWPAFGYIAAEAELARGTLDE
jgi:tetratricopeptide (TPR) repeat protein